MGVDSIQIRPVATESGTLIRTDIERVALDVTSARTEIATLQSDTDIIKADVADIKAEVVP